MFFPVPWRDLNWNWEAVIWYMVCGQAVCVYVFVWTVIMSVCTCLLVCLSVYERVQTWSDCCVWDLFQWLNTAPIVVSPKPDRRFRRTARLKNIPQNVSIHTNHTNLWVLGVWIRWGKKKSYAYSVGSVLCLLGREAKRKTSKPWAFIHSSRSPSRVCLPLFLRLDFPLEP